MPQLFALKTTRSQTIVLAITLFLTQHSLSATAEGMNKQTFNIPAQSLQSAISQLSEEADLLISYPAELVKGMTAPSLSGQYTVKEALDKLLIGTRLTSRLTPNNAITIEKVDNRSGQSNSSGISEQKPITLPKVHVVGNAVYDVKEPYNEDYVLPNATAGTKTDTPIMETPLNIQVVSKQVMKDQQVITLGDALKNVSGVIVNSESSIGGYYNNQAGSETNIILRGFTSQTTFRNGFRLQQGGANRNMSNVESVEVLKGPAAILYGLVEPGGMVNVITKQPLATPYYAINQQFGSYDNYRTTVDTTGPIVGNTDVLYRMNMSYQNTGAVQDYVGSEDIFLAPVLKWVINPKTQITFEFEYDHKHQGLGNAFNPFIGGQLLSTPMTRNYGAYSPATTETFFGGVNWSHQFNDDWGIKHRFSVNQQSFTAKNYTFPSLAVDSGLYSLFYNGGNPINGLNGINVFRETFGNLSQNNTYSTNLDLTGHFNTLGLKHTLLLGSDYYRLSNAYQALRPGYANGQLFTMVDPYNPVNPGLAVPGQGDFSSNNQQQTDQYGLYFQDQIKLPYDVHVTGGIRYQYLHQNTNNNGADANFNGANSHDAVTPRVGVLWHPQSWVSLYANYTESFGANTGFVWGGPGNTLSGPGLVNPIAPTSAMQYEGGIKTEFFDGRLRATLAYYDLTKTNVATGDPNHAHDCGGGGGDCSLAIGAIRSRGPELDIQGEILPGWNAIATYTNTDIIVTKTNANNDPLNGMNVGSRMVNVPRNTANFWSTYELQEGDFKGLKFGGGVTVREGQIGLASHTLFTGVYDAAIKTPGYATLGLMTAYSRTIGKSKVTIQLNVDNLLDKHYYTNINGIYNEPAGAYAAYANYGTPRTVMGSISLQY